MIQDFFSATVESCWIWTILRRWNPITSKWQIQSVFRSKRKDASKSESNISNTSFWNLRRHDLLWLFMIFLHIYLHLQSSFHWQFLPVSSNQSSKDSIRHLLIKISLVFVCYFCSVDHSVYDLSTVSGQYSCIPCCAYVLLSISKETNLLLPASLFVLCWLHVVLVLFLMLSIIHSVSSFIHMDKVQNFIQNPWSHNWSFWFSPISSYINLPENISAGWLRISTMPLSGGLRVFSHAVLLFSFLLIFHTIIMIFIPIMIYMFTFPWCSLYWSLYFFYMSYFILSSTVM